MISKQLQDQLSLLIIRSSMKGKYAILQIAEDNHITMMPAMTLCLLEPNQPVPMKSLATFMSCDPSNVTGIVEQLVNEGLVERKEVAHDRRIKTVTLTPKGLALRDKFLEITTSTRLPNLDALNEDEIERLIAILEKATATSATNTVAIAVPA
ncbi:MAG TPA: MarR family winged helix-turn-helix transcriptional regulator [Candidatus Saccharimonadales bacterium]|jgi:DNA-binding MarR family transcriptional regulator|nr:MarR family winged helix-turn-helix transcriptional regulator [Candidatus Saccharimonadales bacterium]